MQGFFSKDSIVAPPGFNRWLVPPAACGMHLCIGSVYAWSIYNPALTKAIGVATASADDWTLGQVVWVFMVAILFLGLSAAFAGRWIEDLGPRTIGLMAAGCWIVGHLVASAGMLTHQLWLVYLGYGAIGGCGMGLGYVSPVGMLIRWFPDRRGMATGMAIMGFGGGAMLAAPLKTYLLETFYKAPDYLGRVGEIELLTEAGRRFVDLGGRLQEVVVVSAEEAAQMVVPGSPGVYLVGTGSVGATATLVVMGLLLGALIFLAALGYRIPAVGWLPDGWTPPSAEAAAKKMITRESVHVDQALRTPQFYLLWVTLCFNVTAGIGVIGVARTMVLEIFGTSLPTVVDAGFAATYVLAISLFNMVGRVVWASASDILGRKNTFWIFFGSGIALYLSIPLAASQAEVGSAAFWLAVFCVATMIIFSMFGGGFATIPAYLADIFGTRYVGGIFGRTLTAWSAAGILGPLATTMLRQRSLDQSILEIAATVDPQTFVRTFGATIEQLDLLMANNTVTLAKLLEVAPPGTVDPTPGLYNSTMYLMSALLAVAMIANALVRPVDPSHHIQGKESEG